jgi:two-component system, cell cycle sensor histidine kinase and response regulator CckA
MNPVVSNSPNLRSVVVNDDLTQRQLLAGLLQKEGLEVQTFENAETALESMKHSLTPQLIVTDLYMPGIDGWRFCRLLRSPEYVEFNQVPVLVVSATYSGEETTRITTELGANAFLPMPIDVQKFIEQVRALLKSEKTQDVLKVLVVENDPILSTKLVEAFHAHGYQAHTAFTYQESLDRIGQTAYDVAVLAYHLPDGLGDTLLERMQKKDPDCVCIMMTFDPQPQLALTWMKMGAAAYLRKPFEPEYLIVQCERARRERSLLRIQGLLEIRTRQLRESEKRYRALFEQSPDGVVILNPETGQLIEFNDQVCQQLGYTREEFGRLRVSDIEVSESTEEVRLHMQKICREGHDDFETRQRTRQGEIRNIHVTAQIIGTDQHPIYHCIWRDITEYKRAVDALRLSESKFSSAFRVSPDSININRLKDGLYIETNEGFTTLTGYTSEEVVGKTSIEINIWANPEDRQQLVKGLREYGQVINLEAPFRIKNGQIKICLMSARIIELNHETCILSITRDITERKQVEEALKISEERYHLIDEASQDLIFSTDSQSHFTHVNSKLCKMLGLQPEQIIGKTIEELGFLPEQHPDWVLLHQRVFAEDNTVTAETITPIPGGDLRCFEIFLNPIHNKTGAIIGIAGTLRDITTRKMAEAKINEQLEELRRWHKVTLGREVRILELKGEVNQLLGETGKPPRYPSAVEINHDL